MKAALLTILFATMILLSCENALVKEVALAGFPKQSLPLVKAYLNPADTLIKVYIHHAEPAVGDVPEGEAVTDPVTDAQVWLNGPQGETALSYQPELAAYVVRAQDFALQPGNWYSLRVITGGGQEVTANTYLPAGQVEQETVVLDYSPVNEGEQVSLGWRDLLAEGNFYYLHQYTYDYGYDPPALVADVGYFPVSDAGLDGQMLFTENFDLPHESERPNIVYVLYQVDENFFRYHQSLKEIRSNTDNEFAEPFNLYTNVKGGLGIFAAMSPQMYFTIRP